VQQKHFFKTLHNKQTKRKILISYASQLEECNVQGDPKVYNH